MLPIVLSHVANEFYAFVIMIVQVHADLNGWRFCSCVNETALVKLCVWDAPVQLLWIKQQHSYTLQMIIVHAVTQLLFCTLSGCRTNEFHMYASKILWCCFVMHFTQLGMQAKNCFIYNCVLILLFMPPPWYLKKKSASSNLPALKHK